MTERGGEEESMEGVPVRSDRGEVAADEGVFLAGVSMVACLGRVVTSEEVIGGAVVRGKSTGTLLQREEEGLTK